jgi:hypothetical protein
MENATSTRQKALTLNANDFERRFQPRLWEGRHWDIALWLDPSQQLENYDHFDDRAAWFYEAVTTSKGMVTKTLGVGQVYFGAYLAFAAGQSFHDLLRKRLLGIRRLGKVKPSLRQADRFDSLEAVSILGGDGDEIPGNRTDHSHLAVEEDRISKMQIRSKSESWQSIQIWCVHKSSSRISPTAAKVRLRAGTGSGQKISVENLSVAIS